MVKQLYQPSESNLCGQTCVAMLAGISLRESIVAFGGKMSATRTKDLVQALSKLNIGCGDRLIRLNKKCEKPDVSIVKLHFNFNSGTHWVLWYKGKIYDPSTYGSRLLLLDRTGYQKDAGARQTSYLPIYIC